MKIAQRLWSYTHRKLTARLIAEAPILVLVGLAWLGYVRWWVVPVTYICFTLASYYYYYFRYPAMMREMNCVRYFGTITCEHGVYLPDFSCDPCVDKLHAKLIGEVIQMQKLNSFDQMQDQLPKKDETVH